MAGLGVRRAVEAGPGKVLASLVKRIAKEIEVQNAETAADVAALAGRG